MDGCRMSAAGTAGLVDNGPCVCPLLLLPAGQLLRGVRGCAECVRGARQPAGRRAGQQRPRGHPRAVLQEPLWTQVMGTQQWSCVPC